MISISNSENWIKIICMLKIKNSHSIISLILSHYSCRTIEKKNIDNDDNKKDANKK